MSHPWVWFIIFWVGWSLGGKFCYSQQLNPGTCDRTAVLNLFWKHLDELLKLPEVEDLPHFKLLKVGKRKGR